MLGAFTPWEVAVLTRVHFKPQDVHYHCTLARITASRPIADKVIFGHVAAVLTAGREMVECFRNGHSTAGLLLSLPAT